MEEVKNIEIPKPGTKAYVEAELAAAKAELEALQAEKEAMAAAKAELEAEVAEPVAQREKIFIPKGYANDEPNLFVSINGVNYLLPKGKESEVPKFVADEIKRSWKAQQAMDQHIDELMAASK